MAADEAAERLAVVRMTLLVIDPTTLYRARRGIVDYVDVPELGYLMVRGVGAPEGPAFAAAIQALFTVSYGAHFAVKKSCGTAPRVMPLEALWSEPGESRDTWQWLAMIAQLEPIDDDIVCDVIEQARAKNLQALERLSFEHWEEGLSAQTLHVGPYDAETATIGFLHEMIRADGYRPRGRHHEIYLGDPRRSAPEKLRTILRQPVEPVTVSA
jgi:hypothetical protein